MELEVRRFEQPDEQRSMSLGQFELVRLAGTTVGRASYEPGWKWSENVKPIAGTDSCQVSHLGYVLSGRMRVHMDDGGETEVSSGQVVAIPPGHDAEVVGDEACVMVDFGEFGDYAKRT